MNYVIILNKYTVFCVEYFPFFSMYTLFFLMEVDVILFVHVTENVCMSLLLGFLFGRDIGQNCLSAFV